MSIIKPFVVLALTSLPFLVSAEDSVVEYYSAPLVVKSGDGLSYNSSNVKLVIDREGVRVFSGHSSVGGERCGDSNWSCISIPFFFNFSVRRDWKRLPAKWSHNLFDYVNLGEEKISVFGRTIVANFICSSGGSDRSISPTQDTCFHFSSRNGIVAIYFYENGFGDESSTAYYLVGDNGLFAKDRKDRGAKTGTPTNKTSPAAGRAVP
jgi:hypothetical protein